MIILSSYLDSIYNTELAIAMEDIPPNTLGKFYIPVLTPNSASNKSKLKYNPYNELHTKSKDLRPQIKNIVSGNATSFNFSSKFYTSNYVELMSPYKLFKGDKVIVNIMNSKESISHIENYNIIGKVG